MFQTDTFAIKYTQNKYVVTICIRCFVDEEINNSGMNMDIVSSDDVSCGQRALVFCVSKFQLILSIDSQTIASQSRQII